MATCEKSAATTKPSKNEATFVYGHDTKKFRLRAVSAEKDSFSKYISKPLAKKISWTQLILAVLICSTQIVTMSLVVGRYSWDDSMSCMGAGIWSSLVTSSAAILTLWSLKNAKYWKLHMSFALHIISTMACIVVLMVEFGGNIQYLKRRIWTALYDDHDSSSYYGSSSGNDMSAPMLITSLVLNTFMATGSLVQLVSSFVMTLMTGRSLCCGQSKAHGKLFELEIAGSETADGMAIVKNLKNHHGVGSIVPPTANLVAATAAPPPYAESVAESV